jgi:hypothetical protein
VRRRRRRGTKWSAAEPMSSSAAHLDEIRLVLLVPRRDEPVHLTAQAHLAGALTQALGPDGQNAHLLVVVVRDVPLRQARLSLPVLHVGMGGVADGRGVRDKARWREQTQGRA